MFGSSRGGLLTSRREESIYPSRGPTQAVEVGARTFWSDDVANVLYRRSLSKLAFKRVREARAAYRTNAAKLPHEEKIELEQEYASLGLFDFKSQTAQVPSSQVYHLIPFC